MGRSNLTDPLKIKKFLNYKMTKRLISRRFTIMILQFVMIGLVSSNRFSDSFDKYLNSIRSGNMDSEGTTDLLSMISNIEDSSQTMPQTDFMQQYLSDKSGTGDENSWFKNYQTSHG